MTRTVLDVLIAEDDRYTREFMEMLLSDLGHQVTFCEDGARAVDLVVNEGRRFDIVLMDAQMPVLDGVEAIRRIRAHAPSAALPIMCVSAKASGRTREEAIDAGADRFLTKPCWDDELLQAMQDVLIERGVLKPDQRV